MGGFICPLGSGYLSYNPRGSVVWGEATCFHPIRPAWGWFEPGAFFGFHKHDVGRGVANGMSTGGPQVLQSCQAVPHMPAGLLLCGVS
jgi:hypothetical protein